MSFLSLVASRLGRSRSEPPQAEVLFRQLRHQTKNALQRVINEITGEPELQSTPHGRMLAARLEARIILAAEISDQLFDYAPFPAAMAERLRAVGESTIVALRSTDQQITLDVFVEGSCSAALKDPVVRIVNDMISNAVKHGLALLKKGRIEVALKTSASGATVLTVRDDGWGVLEHALNGEGVPLIGELSTPYGGQFMLRRSNGWTESVVTFPPIVPVCATEPPGCSR